MCRTKLDEMNLLVWIHSVKEIYLSLRSPLGMICDALNALVMSADGLLRYWKKVRMAEGASYHA